MPQTARIGILTVSDRASRGEYEDRGGPAIREYLDEVLASPWEPVARIVSDDLPVVEQALKDLCDEEECCLVITTGGTGPAQRDITPEATAAVCDKMMPGFGELMRQVSLKAVPTAILSRQTAGIRLGGTDESAESRGVNPPGTSPRQGPSGTLIVNLPGQPKAIRECLDAVFPAIPYCIDLIDGPYLTTDASKIKAFRPKK